MLVAPGGPLTDDRQYEAVVDQIDTINSNLDINRVVWKQNRTCPLFPTFQEEENTFLWLISNMLTGMCPGLKNH